MIGLLLFLIVVSLGATAFAAYHYGARVETQVVTSHERRLRQVSGRMDAATDGAMEAARQASERSRR